MELYCAVCSPAPPDMSAGSNRSSLDPPVLQRRLLEDADAQRNSSLPSSSYSSLFGPRVLEHQATDAEENGENEDTTLLPKVTSSSTGKLDKAVRRGLKERHLSVFAVTGMMGTGIYLTSGRSLADAGPAGALLGYTLIGLVTTAVAYTAAEMSAFSPDTGGFIIHAKKFVDSSLGAAIGWNFAYSLAITQAVEIVACTLLVTFWTDAIPRVILITGFWIGMIGVNMLPVWAYGEVEFAFGIVKIALVIGVVILGLVIDAGGAPNHDRLGFRYWKRDAFREFHYSGGTIPGLMGRLLAIWNTLINASFAFAHVQIVAIAGRETQNPRIAIPRALSRTALRVFGLYLSTIFIIGLILPATHPVLRADSGTAASSPFAIAATEAGIASVPAIINAVVLTSAFSSGAACIFISSRSLVALANESHAPESLRLTNAHGVPYVAVAASSTVGALAYLSAADSTAMALVWLVNLSAVAGLVCWCALCISYLRLRAGIRAQGFKRRDMPYRAPFQPFLAWFALISSGLVLMLSGWTVFLQGNFSLANLLSNYANVVLFLGLLVVWKLRSGSKWVPADRMELSEEFEQIIAERDSSYGRTEIHEE